MVGFSCDRFVDISGYQAIGQLADELKCSICLNVFDDAVDTQCGHTFCYSCLNQWLSRPESHVKACPECRAIFVTREWTPNLSANQSKVIVIGDEFISVNTNRRLNAVIGRLRMKCQYEWNGCTQVCPLESMAAHHNNCEHQLCRTCGLAAGLSANEHNCIELLLKDREESMDAFEAIIQSRDEKLAEISVDRIDINSRSFMKILSVDYIMFGKYRTSGHSIQLTEEGIRLINISPNSLTHFKYHITVPFVDIQSLTVCADSSLSLLAIKPTEESAQKIAGCISLFDFNSNDNRRNNITIVLEKPLYPLLTTLFLTNCRLMNSNCGIETMDATEGQALLDARTHIDEEFEDYIDIIID